MSRVFTVPALLASGDAASELIGGVFASLVVWWLYTAFKSGWKRG